MYAALAAGISLKEARPVKILEIKNQ